MEDTAAIQKPRLPRVRSLSESKTVRRSAGPAGIFPRSGHRVLRPIEATWDPDKVAGDASRLALACIADLPHPCPPWSFLDGGTLPVWLDFPARVIARKPPAQRHLSDSRQVHSINRSPVPWL